MEVNLIGMMRIHSKYHIKNKYSHESEALAAACMHGCRTEKDFETILEENDNKFVKRMVQGAIKSKSGDVKMPHATVPGFTDWVFELRGLSRSLTHQLVRHRTAWYLQISQRAVNPTKGEHIVPQSIIDNGYEFAYNKLIRQVKGLYNLMSKDGVPLEDARYILPNATPSNVYMKIDGSNLIHFLKLRTDKHAQWEIRDLANRMWELVKVEAPNIFSEELMEYWW